MFSTKLTRAANRASPAAIIANPTSSTVGCRSHRRRHSSSKASCPPDSNASGPKSAPATKVAATAATASHADAAGITDASSVQPRAKRVSKARKPRAASMSKVEDRFAGLPSVESTQSWRYNDFSMSSFFSLYRPLALNSTIPQPSTADEFANIFEAKSSRDAWHNGNSAEGRPEDVIYSLHPFAQELNNGQFGVPDNGHMEGGSDFADGNSYSIKHLDGAPSSSSPHTRGIDDLVSRFSQIPFQAPPPPEPFPTSSRNGRKSQEKQMMKGILDGVYKLRSSRTRSYQTIVTMTESTSEDGQSILIAERSPFVQVPNPEEETLFSEQRSAERQAARSRTSRLRRASAMPTQRATRMPNRRIYAPSGLRQHRGIVMLRTESQRAIRRAPTRRVDMVLISVKRQRKLKMKKHKYKKLMKKTRTLRRRQDRA